jgi:hypothetical protein
VGRFRAFVAAWNGGAGFVPAEDLGKHAHLNGGLGLANSVTPGSYEPRWNSADVSYLAPTDQNLSSCNAKDGTEVAAAWTPTPGADEALPINCGKWAESYAFCFWDRGFLPSEAE